MTALFCYFYAQYGTLESCGHVDFYPGSGPSRYGCYQPGCYDVFDVIACSHSRAHEYYMSSIKDAMCIADRICHGDPKSYPKNCSNLTNDTGRHYVTMGYWWVDGNTTPGSYTVEVSSTPPYCSPSP